MKILKIVLMLMLSMLMLVESALAAPDVSVSLTGIDDYSKCSYGDRAGASYITKFANALKVLDTGGTISYLQTYVKKNGDVTTASIKNAPKTTIFAYAGHGLNYNATNNALHVNTTTSGKTHATLGEASSQEMNLITTKTTFTQKYVVLYSCNQLTNGGSGTKGTNIINMMNGTRLMMGFASKMYLDSREATEFGRKLGTNTICEAYMLAAKKYQAQRSDASSIARIVGYTDAKNDRLRSNAAFAPKASTNPTKFGIIDTLTIPATGVTI